MPEDESKQESGEPDRPEEESGGDNGEEGLSDVQRALMGDPDAFAGESGEGADGGAGSGGGSSGSEGSAGGGSGSAAGESARQAPVQPGPGGEAARERAQQETPEGVSQPTRSGAIQCYNHPEEEATFQCPECNIYYCDREAKLWRGKLLCEDCAREQESQWVNDNDMVPGVDYDPDDPSHMFEEEVPDFDPAAGENAGVVSSPVRRAVQGVLDLTFSRLLTLVGFLISAAGGEGQFIFSQQVSAFLEGALSLSGLLAVTLVVDFFYFGVFLALVNRTPGMWMTNMRVCTEFGDFLGLPQVLLRTFVQVVTLGLGLVISPFLSTRQALHDSVAGSVVINYSGVRAVDPNDRAHVKTV